MNSISRRSIIVGTPVVGLSLALSRMDPAFATPGVDDYPIYLKNAPMDSLIDPWRFLNRECTSFVAWRLNNDNRVGFTNGMTGPNGITGWFGSADTWGPNATKIGFAVNSSPATGAVAWWSSKHVAWVKGVRADGSIDIEEYNYAYTGTYHARNVTKYSGWPTGFIHIRDLGGLEFIKTKNTGSGKVELFTIPGPNYQASPSLATPTWFSPGDANNGWFQFNGK